MAPGEPARRTVIDDQGTPLVLAHSPIRRVVSLVPSLTDAIAVSAPGLLVGATDWCSHPAGLDVVRIGGTKNPDTTRIAALRPDLVVANEEENRAPDLEALRAAGIPVWVTEVRTLDQAFRSLDRLLTLLTLLNKDSGLPRPQWLDDARRAWAAVTPLPGHPSGRPRRAVVPVWRRPWMVVGRDTFAGDLLRRLGVEQLYADHDERYPAIPIDQLRASGADLVVLPDEPYRFTGTDGPEAFPGLPAALVSGRHLTWYGPSLTEAATLLRQQLQAPLPPPVPEQG
ncbi:ABC-type Fe3+-hydroxamate transport system substrate-binding protein [Streptacidiphilus sp. BW17]|uniref:helical backbone metal receptor n=1 Tax=Streptacidiphilus sp. BW17 TaxID=3156274 RepID=UPI003511D89C